MSNAASFNLKINICLINVIDIGAKKNNIYPWNHFVKICKQKCRKLNYARGQVSVKDSEMTWKWVNDARHTTVIKATKVVLQLFIIHSFSVRKSQRKLRHESYRAQEEELKLCNHSALWLIKGKHRLTSELLWKNLSLIHI